MAPGARSRWLAVVAALFGHACAVHSAPPGWLPKAKDLPRWSRGAWIQVEPVRGAGRRAAGELIAVGQDEIHVLTGRDQLTRRPPSRPAPRLDLDPRPAGPAGELLHVG